MTNINKSRLAVAFGFFSLLLLAGHADAAKVLQVKGSKAMIQLEGMSASSGDEVFALNAEQKRKAVIRISQVKGDRAVGNILKGAAEAGMSIAPKGASAAPSSSGKKVFSSAPSSSSSSGEENIRRKSYKRGFGVLAGMAMNTAALSAKTRILSTTYEDNLAMKGNSYNLKAIYDYHMSPKFTIRGAVGLETLSVTSSTSKPQVCSNTTSCILELNYIAFEGAAQFNFVNSNSMRVWAGGGYSFLMAMSKNNNISNLEATSTNQVILLGGGADFAVGKTGYVPVTVEYGLFPFAGINLSSIYLRAGYGWKF